MPKFRKNRCIEGAAYVPKRLDDGTAQDAESDPTEADRGGALGMGRFYDIIQAHMDAQPYGVSVRQIAQKLDVSPNTLKNWRTPKDLIEKKHILAVARLTGVPYHRVLDALLEDTGYLHANQAGPDDERRGETA